MTRGSGRPSRNIRGGVCEPLVAVGLGAVMSVVAWLRLDPTTRGTVWAEDGVVFLSEREALGPVDSLFHVYAGYLHLVPRLLSVAADLVAPVELYATTVTALCCVVMGFVCSLVFLCAKGLVDSVAIRSVIASITVLVPAGSIEIMGNLANLHWYFLWLSPWLLLARPTKWRYSIGLAVVALVAGLTEIQVALFLPLALFCIRDRRLWPVVAGLAAGVLAQVTATVTHPRLRPEADIPGVVDQVKGYLLNVIVPTWKPSVDGAGSLLTDHGWRVTIVMALPFLLAGLGLVVTAGLALRRPPLADNAAWLAAVTAIALGATGPFVGAVVLNPSSRFAYDSFTLAQLSERTPLRYGVVPSMFLLAGVLLWAGLQLSRRHTATGMIAASVVGLLVWHVTPEGTRRSDGPGWRDGVNKAQDVCRTQETPPPVGAAPKDEWAVSLDCSVLLED